MFRFKRFTINDDRCAMKVGTDGVLLGAWADVDAASHILDIGTGSGLIALMLAQRNEQAHVTGLELDSAAAEQARENVADSPFAAQVDIVTGDFLSHQAEGYDAIVSNPPFFEEDLLPPDAERASARHTAAGLTFETLVVRSAALLREGGSLQVIIPKTAQGRFHALCNAQGLVLVRATDVRTVIRKEPKRVLLHFVKGDVATLPQRDELVLMTDGQRSADYSALCHDFYL